MKKTHLYFLIAILSMLTFACSLFSGTPTEEQPATPEIAPQETVEVILPIENPTSTLPVGVVTESNGVLSLFDRDGYTLLQINTPGLSYADENNVHFLSSFPQGSTSLPVLYFSFEQNSSLLVSHAGQVSTLISVPDFSGLIGAQGTDIVAYTSVEYADDNLISRLYAGEINALPTTASVFTENDAQGWGLVALAIDVDGEKPAGIWYSKRPWGIGGDIVFDPRRTLSYLDLRTGVHSQYLGVESNPSAISADRKWLAYTNDDSAVAGIGTMVIRNVATGENISYPLQNVIEQRGAGAASFSPSNKYLAWMEGNGWQMAETPNFHSAIRVGNMNGNIAAEFADTAFVATSGLGVVSRVEPVGWFDDNTLVVMVRGQVWNDAVLMMVDIPSQNINLLAHGVFVGFIYP